MRLPNFTIWRAFLPGILLAGLLSLPPDVARGQLTGLPQAQRDALMQQCRQIGQCLFSYATDNVQNNNAYPDGKSSTEIFQKLIDGNYVTDPTLFYFPLPGKTKPAAGQKLKPENVCFDVTAGVDADSSDLVPLVFVTGYKVSYAPGAPALPLAKPYPPAIIAFYKGNSARVLLTTAANSDGSIANFVSPDFKDNGKTYLQLTPDGPLTK